MNTIQLDDTQLKLVQTALELYARLGCGQFDAIENISTVSTNLIKEPEKMEPVRTISKLLSNSYTGHTGNSSYGIFSEKVGRDCKLAYHISKEIGHFLNQGNYIKSLQHSEPSDIMQLAYKEDLPIKIEKT